MRAILLAAMFVAAVAAGYLAADRVTDQPQPAITESPALTVQPRFGELGEEYRLTGAVVDNDGNQLRFPTSGRLTGTNLSAGELTSITEGQMLVEVDLQPTFAIESRTPFFRPLGLGDSGRDVLALQVFLEKRGYYSGSLDGDYGGQTATAVREWRADAGAPRGSDLPLGLAVAIPEGGTSVRAADLEIGDFVNAGDPLATLNSGSPLLVVDITEQLRARALLHGVDYEMRDDTQVVVLHDTSTSENSDPSQARLSSQRLSDFLGAGDATAEVWAVIQRPTEGWIVPTATFHRREANEATVVSAAGADIKVAILVEVGGEALVEGLDTDAPLVLP